MSYKRVLTIQDISCFGQCSLTVALPIISACGVETVILPSAVLSTHTAGFKDFTVTDLSKDIPKIAEHWKKEEIKFDCVYTGYLGSCEQIDYVLDIFSSLTRENALKIVDPAMADNGKLYPAFDMEYANSMKRLCAEADIVVPNITEACFLTDTEYKTEYDEKYIISLLEKLTELGAKSIVLTGVGYSTDKTGVCVYENNKLSYYEHNRNKRSSHGTGDIYASAFVGSLMNGKSLFDSAKIAADYTLKCIENTVNDDSHWYGVKFETALCYLIEKLK